jgi:hypothetical protein
LNQTQIDDFDFQVGKVFDQVLKRKTGQIILEGIHHSGWAIVVTPYWETNCNSITVGRPARDLVEGQGVNVVVGFKFDPSCFVDPKTKNFQPGGTPTELLFHELVHAFRFVTGKISGPAQDP